MNAAAIARGTAAALVLSLAGAAFAQTAAELPKAAPNGPPAGFVAPADPKPDESNAERSKSQPGNNQPFWSAVRGSGEQPGYSSLPGRDKGVLIQGFAQYPGSRYTTAGEAWRQVRNRWILPYGGSLLLIVAVAIAAMWFGKGPIGGHVPDTGRRIERFTAFERAAHWTNATAFIALALSGLVMAFGKFFLLPIIGSTLFGWLTYALKNVHNFVGPVFVVSLVVVFITFVRDNFPGRGDLTWLVRAGGLFGEQEVPSHRFNAGEKVIFWGGVFVLGAAVAGSGLVLDMLIPGLDYARSHMQIANMVHAVASVLMIAMFAGHIYLGTIGMKGALGAMRSGYVTEGWAREHHALWAEDVASGKIPAQRSKHPPHAPESPVAPA